MKSLQQQGPEPFIEDTCESPSALFHEFVVDTSRVHHVYSTEFIGERLQQFLSEEGFFKTSGSWERSLDGMERLWKPESHCSRDC